MGVFIRQAVHGQLGRYLQVLVLALLIGGAATYVTVSSGCDCDSKPPPAVRVSPKVTREQAQTSSSQTSSGRPSVQAVVEAWHLQYYVYASPAVTITQSECQDWADFLQSDDTFVGFRAPTSEDPSGWPVIFTQPQSATLEVGGTSMIGYLEYRPERAAFLEENLPSASGEHWVPLGIETSPTLTCPSGELVVEPGANELFLNLWLDLDATERVLPLYLCYEGQEGPPGVSAADLSIARLASTLGGVGATSFQGDDITCLGPYQQPLKEIDYGGPPSDDWVLLGPVFTTITPTQVISLEMVAEERMQDALTINLDYASDLDLAWGLYRNTDRSGPITPTVDPFEVDWDTSFWVIADVPGGDNAPDPGPYTLVVTGTAQAGGSQSAHSVLLWQGVWVAPSDGGNELFLPAVLKQ